MEVPKVGKFVGSSLGDLSFWSDDTLSCVDECYLGLNGSKPKHTKNIIMLGIRKPRRTLEQIREDFTE